MGAGEPERDHVERPAWLWEKPSGDFQDYAPTLPRGTVREIWYGLAPDDYLCSLYDTHKAALEGNPRMLRTMKLFHLALLTRRLKS